MTDGQMHAQMQSSLFGLHFLTKEDKNETFYETGPLEQGGTERI